MECPGVQASDLNTAPLKSLPSGVLGLCEYCLYTNYTLVVSHNHLPTHHLCLGSEEAPHILQVQARILDVPSTYMSQFLPTIYPAVLFQTLEIP